MKLSRYTYLFESEGEFYMYNSQTCFFSQIGEGLYEAIINHDYESIPVEILNDLISKKVIQEQDDSELFYLQEKVRFEAQCHMRSHMNIVIVPTTDCNFNCPYCFEGNKTSLYMTQEVQDKIVKYLSSDSQLKTIHITWFGGEPLMGIGIMESLYSKIKELEKEDKKIISQNIVTNGYLINRCVIDFINSAKVDSMQITIDGNEESHNRLRCLKSNGKPTFKIISDNIALLLKECSDLKIALRVNINRDNSNTFAETYRHFNSMNSERIGISPGFIREDSVDGVCPSHSTMDERSRMRFYKKMHEEGVNVSFMPTVADYRGCMMQVVNSFVVGPQGELYKCWNDVNCPERAVGHIDDDEILNKLTFFHMLASSHQFADEKCRDCHLFPVCNGGCGWYRVKNLMQGTQFPLCNIGRDRHVLEQLLLLSKERGKNKGIQVIAF